MGVWRGEKKPQSPNVLFKGAKKLKKAHGLKKKKKKKAHGITGRKNLLQH